MEIRKLLKNDDGNVKMVGAVVGLFVTLAVVILVFYNIAASIDADALDQTWKTNDALGFPANNATNATLDQAATFFTIAPIIGIVVVAVVILGYVSRIG